MARNCLRRVPCPASFMRCLAGERMTEVEGRNGERPERERATYQFSNRNETSAKTIDHRPAGYFTMVSKYAPTVGAKTEAAMPATEAKPIATPDD